MYVEFLKTTENAENPQEVIGTVTLQNGKAVFSKELLHTNLAETTSIPVFGQRRKEVGKSVLTVDDGEEFLRQLPYEYSGSYLRAMLVD